MGPHPEHAPSTVPSASICSRRLRVLSAVTVGLLPAMALAMAAIPGPPTPPPDSAGAATPVVAAHVRSRSMAPSSEGLVGSAACADCHADAYREWRASPHHGTIGAATPATVLGEFGRSGEPDPPRVRGPTYPQAQEGGGSGTVEITLRQREDGYWAVFESADAFIRANFKPTPSGRYAFRLDYVLGKLFYQTYMTRMPNGEVYVTPVLWDRYERRWRLAGWRPWGPECAHCHVTGLKLQDGPAGSAGPSPWTDPPRYLVRPVEWLEPNVGCELCHGPGAGHVADPRADNIVNPARLPARAQVDICGTCHGMGIANPQTYLPGEPVQAPMNNDEVPPGWRINAFWPTGQHKTYFTLYQGHLMSPHWRGVGLTCAPCHPAHAGGTRLPVADNSQCLLCHTAFKRRLTEHTHHPADSPGSRCVECHMPRNNRFTLVPGVVLMTHVHSHNITLPDPQVNLEHGVPDACSGCHVEEDPAWALEQMDRLWGGPASR